MSAALCGGKGTSPSTPSPAPGGTTWSDEFDGVAGALPDPAKWTYDLGAGGWGNQELQTYTNLPENVHLDGQGHLVIHVSATATPNGYTSARLKTQGKVAFQYGRVEIRAKLPAGQGLWPAFWMLGTNITTAGWPACGEVDIMEHVGRQPSTNYGTLHGPGYSGGNGISSTYTLSGGRTFSEEFHVFAIQWASQSIAFFVDNTAYATVTPAALRGSTWVFDRQFFLILNVAVGGTFPGNPDATTVFPQELIVDYVRVSSQ
jgi:beta-glucanase (GH16 family)